MPQELHVVRCYNCEMFQVDIVKKLPKWTCKMCGEKQSLKKVYGAGTGKDCRELVQDLNQQRITLQDSGVNNDTEAASSPPEYDNEENLQKSDVLNRDYVNEDYRNTIVTPNLKAEHSNRGHFSNMDNKPNKWNKFLENQKWDSRLDTAEKLETTNSYQDEYNLVISPNLKAGNVNEEHCDNMNNKSNKWKKFLGNQQWDSCLNTVGKLKSTDSNIGQEYQEIPDTIISLNSKEEKDKREHFGNMELNKLEATDSWASLEYQEDCDDIDTDLKLQDLKRKRSKSGKHGPKCKQLLADKKCINNVFLESSGIFGVTGRNRRLENNKSVVNSVFEDNIGMCDDLVLDL